MAAMNQGSATGDGAGEVARRIKDYCTQAVANLKAGRLKEVYLFANEALELDGKDAKATALCRHALYALHPKKRLLDKAKALHEEADGCMKEGDYNKALELFSLTKKWHCTPGVLYMRSNLNTGLRRFDLAYVDMTEGLAECKKDKTPFIIGQFSSLSLLGYKELPVREVNDAAEASPFDEMPARYHVSNWPGGLRINHLNVNHCVAAVKTDGMVLKPDIPFDQLAQFLNNHVQGAMRSLTFQDGPQDLVPRLLDEVTVPERLHVQSLNFTEFFRIPWASIERILDGRTLRANKIDFYRLQLPSGVDANKLLQLPAVRECTRLEFFLYTRYVRQLPGLPPLFKNAALVEWVKRSDDRSLEIARDYLSSGLLSFLDALKKDFRQANQVHSYVVEIHCPRMDVVVGLGVQGEKLSNRLGEKMMIGVGEDLRATAVMGHQFDTVFVDRHPPT